MSNFEKEIDIMITKKGNKRSRINISIVDNLVNKKRRKKDIIFISSKSLK